MKRIRKTENKVKKLIKSIKSNIDPGIIIRILNNWMKLMIMHNKIKRRKRVKS